MRSMICFTGGTELSVKAANGTLTQEDREYIQKELEQLKSEIDAIADRTTFNEIPVLQGSHQNTEYTETPVEIEGGLPDFVTSVSSDLATGHLTGTYNDGINEFISGKVNFSAVTADNISELIDGGFNMTCATCSRRYSIQFTADDESSMETSGQHYIYKISVNGVTNGSELIDRIIDGTENGHPNHHYTQFKKSDDGNSMIIYDNRSSLAAAGNRERYQAESKLLPGIAYTTGGTVVEEKSDIFVQAGSEAGQHIDIKLPEINSGILGISSVNVVARGDGVDGAGDAITAFKDALSYVSGERARMGAYQNRLEHTIHNLDNVVENTTAAESAIRDTDMAKEMVAFSNAQILAQTGQSVLAQANQSKQGILSILG